MKRIIDYSFVNSRVSGMFSRMLTESDTALLLKSESVKEFFGNLRKTSYNEFLSGFRQEDINSSTLESIIFAGLFDCFQKIIDSLKDPRDIAFLKRLLLIYELRNVKTILRGKVTNRPVEDLRRDLINIGKYSEINCEVLLGLKGVEEIVNYLADNHLVGGIIRFAYEKYKKDQNLYTLDTAIDINYLSEMYKSLDDINPYDRDRLKRLVGMQIDLNNILWGLRLKFIYSVDPGEVMANLIPVYYGFSAKFLRSIIFENDIKDVFAKLLRLPWAKYVKQDVVRIEDIERGFTMFLRDISYKMFRGNKFCLSGIVGFLNLKRYEVGDLVRILEGKEYGLTYDDVQKKFLLLKS